MIYLHVKNKRSGWLTIYHTVALLQSPRDIGVISHNSQQLLCYFEKITNFGPLPQTNADDVSSYLLHCETQCNYAVFKFVNLKTGKFPDN